MGWSQEGVHISEWIKTGNGSEMAITCNKKCTISWDTNTFSGCGSTACALGNFL